MDREPPVDYYEVLQISASAEPETIHRVYRMLAQRFHPDNRDSGNEARFRLIADAYAVLSDPERRARFDVHHERLQQERWRLVARGAESEHDFALEQRIRLTVLEVLYTRRRVQPDQPGLFVVELEKMVGRAREQLEFTLWYLMQKKLLQKSDNSLLVISAEGVDFLEANYEANKQVPRLRAVNG